MLGIEIIRSLYLFRPVAGSVISRGLSVGAAIGCRSRTALGQ